MILLFINPKLDTLPLDQIQYQVIFDAKLAETLITA
jgi:hypothetical protein